MQNLKRILAVVLLGAGLAPAVGLRPKPARRFRLSRDIDPTIIQDIRYATPNNFIGRPLAGYQAGECVVKREVGLRLKNIQQELAKQKLSLKDVRLLPPDAGGDGHGEVVAQRQGDAGRAALQPGVPQGRPVSARLHRDLFRPFDRRALDLTLVDLTSDNSATFDSTKSYADCTAPVENRAPEGSIDMGTGYDCSDVKANTASPSDHAGTAQMAHHAGGCDAQARLCELF